MSSHQEKSPRVYQVKFITIRYLIALSLVALLSLGAYTVVQLIIAKQQTDAPVINLSGRQRMLSQRLVRDVLLLCLSSDIEEKLKYQKELREILELWSRVHERLQHGDAELRLPGRNSPEIKKLFQRINPYFAVMKKNISEIVQLSPEELFLLSPEDRRIKEILHASENFLKIMDEIVFRYDYEARQKVLSLRRLETVILALVLTLLVLEALFIFRPMAQRVREAYAHYEEVNRRLKTQAAYLESILRDATGYAIAAVDKDFIFQYYNPTAEKLFGYKKEDILGRSLFEVHLKEKVDLKRIERALEEVKNKGFYEYLVVQEVEEKGRKTKRYIQSRVTGIRDEENNLIGFVLLSQDITQRLKWEETLKKINRKLRARDRLLEALLASSKHLVSRPSWKEALPLFLNTLGRALRASRIILWQKTEEEFSPLALWPPDSSPETKFLFAEQLTELQEGRCLEMVKEGEKTVVSPIVVNDRLWGVLEWRFHRADIHLDAESLLLAAEMLAEAIRREELEERLFQAQKLESLGRLTGGIAHDFNNILQVITGNMELAKFALAEGKEVSKYLDNVLEIAQRARELIGNLLAFSRKQAPVKGSTDLNGLLNQLRDSLLKSLGEDIEITLDLAQDLPKLKGEPVFFEQIILNLATNAREAMPQGGRIFISTRKRYLREGEIPGLAPGPYVELVFSDTGCGISAEVKSRLFEPFFTTKEKGTGLGLSSVYGLVKRMRGEILVESTPGKGATFRLYFPLA